MTTIVLTNTECKDLHNAARPSTSVIRYPYQTASFSSIQDAIRSASNINGIQNFGIHIQGKDKKLTLFPQQKSTIDRTSLRHENSPVRKFFKWLFIERMAEGSFVDFFLLFHLTEHTDTLNVLQAISHRKKISIRFVNSFTSPDLSPHNKRIVELYWESSRMRMRTTSSDSKTSAAIAGYERIRVVGKGAFGSAILYRRKDDESLVIIKEINMHDLSAGERQLALNEVNLLSRIEHPNIVSYFDSFEEDGILMIEMEYADGGTLAQFLGRCDHFLPEQTVTELMRQMLCAVAYLHQNNVLHRDLKTANVFLTKENNVKIGDFGISRIMGTNTLAKGAETVVGTPYYISPEMCEGKTYNEKSDIWALGCILYEMVCLQKAFEGENLPALVNKIMRCEYEPVRGPYTSKLKIVIRDMLQIQPSNRPSAVEALKALGHERAARKRDDLVDSHSHVRSALYSFDVSSISLSPVHDLPHRIRVTQVAVGARHQVLSTWDDGVYAWGDNEHGQLGTGDRKLREKPTKIRAMDGKNVKKVVVGNAFTVFLADKGTLLVCGDKRMTGNGKISDDQLIPELINALLRMDIVDVACGDEHIVAISDTGGVFVWGVGANGRLGTGKTDPLLSAFQLASPSSRMVKSVRCGPDTTALLTDDGNMLAMGSNKHNKLNLSSRQGFFTKEKTGNKEDVLVPTMGKPFPARIVDVNLGRNHSGVVLESGLVYLFGMNSHGELGVGTFHPIPFGWHIPVKSLLNKACVMLVCGDGFTIVGTADDELFFWGSKGAVKTDQPLTLEDLEITNPCPVMSVRISASANKTLRWGMKRKSDPEVIEQIIPHPSLVLRLDTSSGEKNCIRLASLACFDKRMFVTIDTTMPNLHSAGKKVIKMQRQFSAPQLNDESKIQTWIRKELEEADKIPIPAYLAQTSTHEEMKHTTLGRDADIQLMHEIDLLKKELKEQSSTFQGHAEQMTLLQTKLSELQTKQAMLLRSEPPPAYPDRKIPLSVNNSRSCSIL